MRQRAGELHGPVQVLTHHDVHLALLPDFGVPVDVGGLSRCVQPSRCVYRHTACSDPDVSGRSTAPYTGDLPLDQRGSPWWAIEPLMRPSNPLGCFFGRLRASVLPGGSEEPAGLYCCLLTTPRPIWLVPLLSI